MVSGVQVNGRQIGPHGGGDALQVSDNHASCSTQSIHTPASSTSSLSLSHSLQLMQSSPDVPSIVLTLFQFLRQSQESPGRLGISSHRSDQTIREPGPEFWAGDRSVMNSCNFAERRSRQQQQLSGGQIRNQSSYILP